MNVKELPPIARSRGSENAAGSMWGYLHAILLDLGFEQLARCSPLEPRKFGWFRENLLALNRIGDYAKTESLTVLNGHEAGPEHPAVLFQRIGLVSKLEYPGFQVFFARSRPPPC